MVRATLRRYSMVRPGERVLCAVSGGADSVAMLDALAALRGELGCELAVAHVDHGLRTGSADDAARVERWARDLGLPFLGRRVEVDPRGSREEAARRARHAALAEMVAEAGARRLALGHTASDRAETMLLFLTRGAGRRGLAAMPPVRDGLVIRPLAEVTRVQARAHAQERGLPFCDDPMNDDPSLTRNRLRAEVLPSLRALNPRADRVLAAAAQDLAEEEAWLEEQAAQAHKSLFSQISHVAAARADELRALPRPLRVRVLRQVLATVRGTPVGLGRRHLEAVEGLLEPGAREAHLAGAIAWRDGAWLCMADRRPRRARLPRDLRIDAPGRIAPRDGIEFEFDLLHQGEGWEAGATTGVHFDAAQIGFPLWIRSPRPGDRLCLEGGRHQKLSERFAASGVPPSLRRDWLVVADASEVVWVPGVRRSGRGRIGPDSRKVLCIRAHGLMFADPYANHLIGRSCTPVGETKG